MASNRGNTSLRCRRRQGDKMREFDRLPAPLRAWLATAALPWRPRSVQRTYDRVLARTRDARSALLELDRIEQRLLAKDVQCVWGEDYPGVMVEASRCRRSPV